MAAKKWASFALKLLVSAILIGLLARSIDWRLAADRLAELAPAALAAAFALFVVLLVVNTVRWRIVMSAIGRALGFARTFRILYIGMFFNQTLPSSIGGDAFRVYLVHKNGIDLGGAITGIMLERVVTLMGLILLVVVTQPVVLARIGDHPAGWVFPALAGLAVLGVIVLMMLDRLPSRWLEWKPMQALVRLARDTRRLFLSPSYAVSSIALGFVGFSLVSGIAFVLARALGIDITLVDCLVLIPPVMLVTTLPISVAGWGVREGAMVTALGFIGVNSTDALLLSVLFGLLGIIVALPGGLVWLAGGERRKEVAEEVAPS
jgi:uncharacterized membrane protein YbhN (UPF0104 family)